MASRIKKLSHENKRRLIHLPSITIEDKSEVGGPQNRTIPIKNDIIPSIYSSGFLISIIRKKINSKSIPNCPNNIKKTLSHTHYTFLCRININNNNKQKRLS